MGDGKITFRVNGIEICNYCSQLITHCGCNISLHKHNEEVAQLKAELDKFKKEFEFARMFLAQPVNVRLMQIERANQKLTLATEALDIADDYIQFEHERRCNFDSIVPECNCGTERDRAKFQELMGKIKAVGE